MKKLGSMQAFEDLGCVRLSENFYMRDFLYSETSSFCEIPNIPHHSDQDIMGGINLCEELLEPRPAIFGNVTIRSTYRNPEGDLGATACIVVPWAWDRHHKEGDWRKLAWWIHVLLPYSSLYFFPKLWAVNLNWCEHPVNRIDSYANPNRLLTKPGIDNHSGDSGAWYEGFPALVGVS